MTTYFLINTALFLIAMDQTEGFSRLYKKIIVLNENNLNICQKITAFSVTLIVVYFVYPVLLTIALIETLADQDF